MYVNVNEMPKLGFGLMRLPETDGQIEMQETCRMVDEYMNAGLNYFDTAYVYHGGKSEEAAREAIVKRYPREAFKLATKLPGWEIHCEEDRDRIFNIQRERAGVEFFDFYLLHAIDDGSYETYSKYDCFNWAIEKKRAGQIKHFGFSFHGSPETLEKILNEHPEVEFVQIQLNYADWKNPDVQSGKLYNILHSRNIPIIVMEPVKGGTLAALKPELEEKYKAIRPENSIASWALRFVATLPGVMTILSGMSNEEQMNDNISTFTDFEPLNDEEKMTVAEVTQIMLDIPQIGCTSCRYCCDGCPMSISIPDIFRTLNTMELYNDEFKPDEYYNEIASKGGKASDCIECGQCEGICPQHLPIIDLLKKAAQRLD